MLKGIKRLIFLNKTNNTKMIVNEQQYRYAKLMQTAKEQANNTVEIDDKEAILLGLESVDELHVNIVSIEWTNTNDITIYSGTKPSLPNILINWDDNTTTEISSSYTNISTFNYNSVGTYNITSSYKNFVTTNSINITVIKKELISIEWQITNEITTYENTQAYLPNIKLNYNNNTSQYITINTSSVILNNPTYYSQIGDYEINATYKGFTTNNIIVHVIEKIEEDEYEDNILIIEALEDGVFNFAGSISYSLNYGETWILLQSGINTPTIYKNTQIYITNTSGTTVVGSTCKYNISGIIYHNFYRFNNNLVSAKNLTLIDNIQAGVFKNCTLLIDAPKILFTSNASSDCGCKSMFENCTSLINAPELPATILKSGYYTNMFRGCTSLITAPELPAIMLAYECYSHMFEGCTSLQKAPVLPATTLSYDCYAHMFQDCTSLTTAPSVLPATTLADDCYNGMFAGCTSLTRAPELPATTLAYSCYYGMFVNCTSMTTVPELPATQLAVECYYEMFAGCTSLTTAPELPATTLANRCYRGMFYNCTSLTRAPELSAMYLANNCYEYMFYGCTSLIKAPDLSATILTEGCYYSMFDDCTSLRYIKMLAINIVNNYNLGNFLDQIDYWVDDSFSCIFVKNIEAQWDNDRIVPKYCKVIYYDTNEDKYYLDQNKEQECDDHIWIIDMI